MPDNGIANIEIGTYTGNGEYGSDNKNSLTFRISPKLVIIRPLYTNATSQCPELAFVWIVGMSIVTTALGSYSGYSNTNNVVSLSDRTLTWYITNSTSSADYQFNKSNTTYIYFTIG